jgi:hypothetical protein
MTPRDRIVVSAHPAELRPAADGVIDVFAALQRQFFWADTVMVGTDELGSRAEDGEVLEGEVVF